MATAGGQLLPPCARQLQPSQGTLPEQVPPMRAGAGDSIELSGAGSPAAGEVSAEKTPELQEEPGAEPDISANPPKAKRLKQAGLFAFLKRKTSETTPEELEAAKAARAGQEKADLDQLAERHAAHQLEQLQCGLGLKKKAPSMSGGAVRKRKARAELAKKKKQGRGGTPRERACVDGEKAAARRGEYEKETHVIDRTGRARKRKKLRSLDLDLPGRLGPKGQRIFAEEEKEIVVAVYRKHLQKSLGPAREYGQVAVKLQREHPTLFGPGAPGLPDGLSRQCVRQIVLRAEQPGKDDMRGRPPALPEYVIVMIVAAMASVCASRATIMSAPMLQPIAIGVILAAGLGSLLYEGKSRRGMFVCGLHFVRGLMKERKWRCVKPQGDTRKVPSNAAELCADMVLRLAYFVFIHEIPPELVINADHTGIMLTPMKGRGWMTDEQLKSKDKRVMGQGDKRQFTLLATTSAAGAMLPNQVVLKGKTSKCLPDYLGENKTYAGSLRGKNSANKMSVCFKLRKPVAAIPNIASFCATYNHWSDSVTSRAYVTDVAIPYFQRTIEAMRAANINSCKAFGKQCCVLILDCWFGWIDSDFRAWIRRVYPFIRLVFVPAACTPVGQPMDAGIIAKMKSRLRRMYGAWVVELTRKQLDDGVHASAIQVPTDVPTLKTRLFGWLSDVVGEMNASDREGIIHCWEKTGLLKAWDRVVQLKAAEKATELFPNMVRAKTVINIADILKRAAATLGGDDPSDDAHEIDLTAGYLGVPFTQVDDEDEWIGWVNWDAVGSSSAAAA
jgi:hypothetical protein